MDKEDYLRTLQDPEAWFKQAFGQKMVADKLLHDVILKRDFLMKMKDNDDYSDYVHLWGNALLHYALGIENGLKGVIVKSKPELVHYKVTDEDVILIDIGGKASKKHDLYSLCNVAGLLDKNNDFQFGGILFRNYGYENSTNISSSRTGRFLFGEVPIMETKDRDPQHRV